MGKRRARIRFKQYLGKPRGNTPAHLIGQEGVVTWAEQRTDGIYLSVNFPSTGKPKYGATLKPGEYEITSGTIEPTPEPPQRTVSGNVRSGSLAQQIRMNKAASRHAKRARGGRTQQY